MPKREMEKTSEPGIFRLGPNWYYIRVADDRDKNGKRRELTATVHDSFEVARLKKAELKLSRGVVDATAKGMTVSQFWETMYRPSIKGLAQSTLINYDSSYTRYIEPRFGNRQMKALKRYDIEQWINSIEKPGAALKAYKTLRQMLRRAYDWEVIAEDPTTRRIKLPKVPKYEAAVYSFGDARTVLQGILGERVEPIVLVMLGCGARREEATALFWEDIKFQEVVNFFDKEAEPIITATVDINKALQYLDKKVVETPLKNDNSKRVGALAPPFSTRLYEIRKESGPLVLDLKKPEMGSLVPDGKKPEERESPDTIGEEWQRLCKRKGLVYVPMKNLRHSCATLMQESGVDASVISALLGHADIRLGLGGGGSSTTYKHYFRPKIETYLAATYTYGKAIGL